MTLANIESEKIILIEETYPINEGLKEHFSTLIEGGMKYFELKSDPTGEIITSERPLRVSV